jgi:hypothetical protein
MSCGRPVNSSGNKQQQQRRHRKPQRNENDDKQSLPPTTTLYKTRIIAFLRRLGVYIKKFLLMYNNMWGLIGWLGWVGCYGFSRISSVCYILNSENEMIDCDG